MLRVGAKRVLGTTSLGVRVPARLYHERVVDHYDNPRNVGSFDKNDPSVGTGLVGAPACGDVMKLQIKVDDKTGKIVDARFKTFGCGSAIASSSVGNHKHKHCSLFSDSIHSILSYPHLPRLWCIYLIFSYWVGEGKANGGSSVHKKYVSIHNIICIFP